MPDTTSSQVPDGARRGPDRELRGLRGPAWVGTRVESGATVPVAGTWEVVEHPGGGDCRGDGDLRALGRGDLMPRCPRCDGNVTWQLSHLALTVAADHPDPGALP